MKTNNKQLFKISNDIEHLNIDDIFENLFFYSYHNKYLKRLQQSDSFDKDDVHYIGTYSSFIGEVFENIIYELLIKYAIQNEDIISFVLKGPHQNHYQNNKNGLMIDINNQIVYKAGYKDVTEFDGLFFTKDSVYFVESTIVKTTTSLRKRLKKKKALLEVLFPNLKIEALIILSKGALGVNVFPTYCTVWVTESLENDKLINTLIYDKSINNKKFKYYKHKKLTHAKDIDIVPFKYFDTINWILRYSRSKKHKVIDFEFLSTSKISRYFEIFSKFYIGHISTNIFIELLKDFEIKEISEEIPLNKIENNQIIVTIEKTIQGYTLVYYLRVIGDKLKRLDFKDNSLMVSNKDPKGFTSAETKYIKYLFQHGYNLSLNDIKKIEENKKI